MSDSEDEIKGLRVLKVGGLNYVDWFESLSDTLAMKGLSAYITAGPNGMMRKQRPDDEHADEQEKFDIKVAKALAIIRRSLGDNRGSIRGITDPAKALKVCKEYFLQSTAFDVAALESRWVNLTPNGDDFTSYMAEMNRIKRDLSENGSDYTDVQMIARMMINLERYPDGHPFKKVHDQIDFTLSNKPLEVTLPYFTRFVTKATHELAEKEKAVKEEEKAFLAQSRKDKDEETAFLTQAKKYGYQKIEQKKSDGRSEGKKWDNASRSDEGCRFCRSTGHKIQDCSHPDFDPKIWRAHKDKVAKDRDMKGKDGGDDPGKPLDRANVASSLSGCVIESSIDTYKPDPARDHERDDVAPEGEPQTISEELYYASTHSKGTIMDSGCLRCMFHDANVFRFSPNLRKYRAEIKIGNGSSIWSTHIGDLYLRAIVDGKSNVLHLSNCMLVPKLNVNLVSIAQLDTTGYEVSFGKGKATVMKNGQVYLEGELDGNLYYAQVEPEKTETALVAVDLNCWHKRLGHYEMRKIPSLKDHVSGLSFEKKGHSKCELCALSKSTRASFPSSTSSTKHPLDLLHVDLAGPSVVDSIGGGRYILVIVDDFSKYYHVEILKAKSEASTAIKSFVTKMETQLSRSLKRLQSDNGGEFVNKDLSGWLEKKGVLHETTTPFTPEQNGVAERAVRVAKEGGRVLLLQANLKPHYWASAVKAFVYARNRTITTTSAKKTPFERFWNEIPRIDDIRVYGCVAYVHVPKHKRETWGPTAKRCVFVGYGTQSDGTKGWVLYDPYKRERIVSVHVTFREDLLWNQEPQFHSRFDLMDTVVSVSDIAAEREGERVPVFPRDNLQPEIPERFDNNEPPPSPGPEEAPQPLPPPAEPQPRRNPERNRRPPGEYWMNRPMPQANIAEVAHEPLEAILHTALLASTEHSHTDPRFNDAKLEELKSMSKHKVWDLVPLPIGRKAISARWVCTLKEKADGSVKEKARLVGRGFTQIEGVDYTEIFAPVVKMESLRLILALSAVHNLDIAQADVKTAFLYGELDEEVYMSQPPGHEVDNKTLVCRLNKSLYGLHQLPRNFYRHVRRLLEKIGLHPLGADQSIFISKQANEVTILTLYVDDALLAASSQGRIQEVKGFLFENFEMTWTDEPTLLLGLQIKRNRGRGTIALSQERFVRSILDEFNMSNSSPTRLPVIDVLPSYTVDIPAPDKRFPYLRLIGKLNYLARGTRPDLAYAVSHLASFCSTYQEVHWEAALRILRYLAGSIETSLTYGGPQVDDRIVGYSDANWGSDTGNRRSVGAYVFLMAGAAITWQSKKQATVSWSTTEAEYLALGAAAREALWLSTVCHEIGLYPNQKGPRAITIFEDNQAAIALSKNPVQHSRTKHIDICHHALRDYIDSKRINVTYLGTSDMLADAPTKPLNGKKLRELCESMGLTFYNTSSTKTRRLERESTDLDIE